MKKFTDKSSTQSMIKHAAEQLGVDLAGLERDEVIAELKKEDASLFATEKATADSATKVVKGKKLTHVTINIHDDSGRDDSETNFIQVLVNGVNSQIMKGVDSKVPVRIYEVIKNAIETVGRQHVDPVTKMKTLIPVQVVRIPHSVVAKHYDNEG